MRSGGSPFAIVPSSRCRKVAYSSASTERVHTSASSKRQSMYPSCDIAPLPAESCTQSSRTQVSASSASYSSTIAL